MTEENGDDEVIGQAFWRSLKLAALALGVLVIVFAAKYWIEDAAEPIEEAEVLAPQSAPIAVAPPDIRFTDITSEAGIDHAHVNGATGDRLLPETMGGGVAVLDYNNDRNPDLLFVSGSPWPWDSGASSNSLYLYRGDGAGRFDDVTEDVGLDVSLYGMGNAVGDYDNDGDVDIYVTAVGTNRLFENRGDAGFVNVSSEAGVEGDAQDWSTGAAFVDYDRDGDLDLFVLNYVVWSRDIDFDIDYRLTGVGRAYGPPTQYAGTNARLYRNDDGQFTDVSAESGIEVANPATGEPMGKGLAVLPLDVNRDGWTDLVVANDTVRNFLFLNDQSGGFTEQGTAYGIAFDNTGAATGAMGIDDAQISESTSLAIAIGNFANEMTSLFVRADSFTVFTDEAIVTGIGPASRQALTFGLFFFDVDLDGHQDLFQVNGHVEDEISVVQPSQQYAQPPQLFWNCGGRCARDFVPVALNGDLATPMVGRGAAYSDIDHDGDLDVVITQVGRPPKLLRNDLDTDSNWTQWDVVTGSGAPALGATVRVVAGATQSRRIEPTRSYLAQVDTVLTFGLGDAESVDHVEIRWPDGRSQIIDSPAINQKHRITPP